MTDEKALRIAFETLVGALAKGDLVAFYGLILSDAVIMDEDLPFRADRAGFQAHIAFHGPNNWENFAWKPSSIEYRAAGSTGVVAGFAMFRGKPRDSGYRLRPRDCQKFRVRAGIMGKKEPQYVPTQRAYDTQ